MSVISLYLFRQLAQTFLILLGVLTGLVWVSQAIRFLNLVIEKGRSLTEFLLLTGYLVPTIAGLVAPTALFIATIYVLYRYNADSELVVTQAAGGSQWRLLRPFAFTAVIVTIFVIFVNTIATPYGMRSFRQKLISVRTDLISTLVQEGQFVSPEAGLTVHIRSRDNGNGDLLGLLFHDTRQNDGQITYLAERARIVPDGTSTSLLMFNGTFQRRQATAQDVDVVRFSEYTIDLDSFGPDREVEYYQASEKFMSELINPDPKDPIFIGYPGKIFAEFHDRLSSPIYPIAMMLIAFIGLASAQSNRLGRWWIIIGVTGVALAVRVLGATMINLMVKTNALFPLAYIIPLLTILSALTFIYYQGRAPGLGPILARRKAELSDRYSQNARHVQAAISPQMATRPVTRSSAAPLPQQGRPQAVQRPRQQAPQPTQHVQSQAPHNTPAASTPNPNQAPAGQSLQPAHGAQSAKPTQKSPAPTHPPAGHKPAQTRQPPQSHRVATPASGKQTPEQPQRQPSEANSNRDQNPVVRLLKNRAENRQQQPSDRVETKPQPVVSRKAAANTAPRQSQPQSQPGEKTRPQKPQQSGRIETQTNPAEALRHLAKSLSTPPQGPTSPPKQKQAPSGGEMPARAPSMVPSTKSPQKNPSDSGPKRTGK